MGGPSSPWSAQSLYGTPAPVANMPAGGSAVVPDATGIHRPATAGSIRAMGGFWNNPTFALVSLLALAFLLTRVAFGFGVSFKVSK